MPFCHSHCPTEEQKEHSVPFFEECDVFHPSDEFKKTATLYSEDIFVQAKNDREAFWAEQATCLDWASAPINVLEWNPPYAKWFTGGKLNACYNCLDRHMTTSTRTKQALIWEGEKGDTRVLTYEQLFDQVNHFANVLKSFGIKKGDTVAIYLPMIPETVVAMLACARIGAIHTVVFGGFAASALQERIVNAEAKLVITADGSFRRGKPILLKEAADRAVVDCPSVQTMIVISQAGHVVSMQEGRDYWYHECMERADAVCPIELMDAEDTLFILYTSGTTGKPKGIVHTTGGYMVGATMTTRWVFDCKPSDIYWCTADVGWITGHTYVVYGPLSNGLTQLMYEGAPDFPNPDRFWQLIDTYGVTILYTSPTAVRSFMKWGEEWVKGYSLSTLRLLGSVGEPINPEAWKWYYTHIGKKRCPIVDTWWQTETGSIMIAPLPGMTSLKPGSATRALPGIDVAIVNEEGAETSSGFLAITSPWPSMLRGIYKDSARYEATYWKRAKDHYYFTGDNAEKDHDGYFWITGRTDDVIKISGHRLSTMEIESALAEHGHVAEAAAIAVSHPIKGQAIVAFVSLKMGVVTDASLEDCIKAHVVSRIGALGRPEKVIFIPTLPKTRSDKVMRRLLRDIAEGRVVGDSSTLADPTVLQEIKGKYEEN